MAKLLTEKKMLYCYVAREFTAEASAVQEFKAQSSKFKVMHGPELGADGDRQPGAGPEPAQSLELAPQL
jgi:hypothetical protein